MSLSEAIHQLLKDNAIAGVGKPRMDFLWMSLDIQPAFLTVYESLLQIAEDRDFRYTCGPYAAVVEPHTLAMEVLMKLRRPRKSVDLTTTASVRSWLRLRMKQHCDKKAEEAMRRF